MYNVCDDDEVLLFGCQFSWLVKFFLFLLCHRASFAPSTSCTVPQDLCSAGETLPASFTMEEMVVDLSSNMSKPATARKRLSSSVTSEAADSESDATSDDSDAFLPAKHRWLRRKSVASSSSEETIICNSIVTTTLLMCPSTSISKQKLHDFFFKLAPCLIQEVRVNPRKNIIAVDTSDEKMVQTLLGLPQLCNVTVRAFVSQGANVTAGVISDVDLELSDDVLKSMIVCTPPCRVISARRLGFSKCVKILFVCEKLPNHIKAGLVRYLVRPFIPKPLQWRECLKLGHVQGFWTSVVVCAKCGANHNVILRKSVTSRCLNCNGELLATDKECPKLKKKWMILKEKAKKIAS